MSIAVFFLNSCKEDCKENGTCPPEYYRYELGEAMHYLWAKPGSYWIYKNTKTGDLDTQTMIGFKFDTVISKGTFDFSKHITIEYDVLSRNIYSSFNHWIYFDKTSKYEANSKRDLETILERIVGTGVIYPFFHPFVISQNVNPSNSNFIGLDSNFIVSSKPYTNVAKFEIAIDGIWEEKLNCKRPNTVYYWAKGVGLIKKDMNGCGYSWELIEYNVIE